MRYANPDNTMIDMGGGLFIPVDPMNLDYATILADAVAVAPYKPPAAPVFTRLAKADLWRRLTNDEGEAVNVVLLAAPIRLRRLYEAATYIDKTDDDYPALQAGLEAALGPARAAEVLAPNV